VKTIKISIFFPPQKVKIPLVSTLVKKYDLEVNILNADIGLDKMGKLVADITGSEWNLESALKYIEEQGIEYEIFSREIIWQEDECVHCGACMAVCPSRALSMDKKDWALTFDRQKCLVCGLCIKACPIGVISLTS